MSAPGVKADEGRGFSLSAFDASFRMCNGFVECDLWNARSCAGREAAVAAKICLEDRGGAEPAGVDR